MSRNIVYIQSYSPDANGLHRMIVWMLRRKNLGRIKLQDKDVARRLGISTDELKALQNAVHEEGLLFCRHTEKRTWYGYSAQDEDVAGCPPVAISGTRD